MALALSRWTAGAARLARPFTPLIDAVRLWLEADGLRMSAAMTFYGLLSLSPLVLMVVGLLGWWMDRSVVESTLLEQVHGVMGERGASVVQAAMASAQRPAEGRLASLVAFVLLLSGATGVFVELQSALERLWRRDDDTPPRGPVHAALAQAPASPEDGLSAALAGSGREPPSGHRPAGAGHGAGAAAGHRSFAVLAATVLRGLRMNRPASASKR